MAALRAFSADAGETGLRGLLIPAEGSDLSELAGLAQDLVGKILYVIRHSEVVAIETGANTVEAVTESVQAWVAELQLISKISRELPGLIEIVRCQDLMVERRVKILKRLAAFVEVREPPIEVDDIDDLEVSGELSEELKDAIRRIAGDFMERLRYD